MTTVVRKVGKNFGLLLGGQAVAAVLGLLALYLMARCLSPVELGIVVLLQTYVATVRELVNLKLFEAIVRYGVPKLDAGDHPSLRRLLRYAFKVDVVSSLAAAGIAVAGARLAGPLFGWESTHTPLAIGFSLALLISAVGTSKGILRLYGRFDALSSMAVVASVARLLGALIAFSFDAGIAGFTLVLALSLVVEYAYINYCGWREVRVRLQHPFRAEPAAVTFSREFPGWWSFVNVVYWQSNLDLLPRHVATLLAGALLGPSGAGLFRIARELSGALAKPAVLLRHAVFPDLTRLWHQGDRAFITLCVRVGVWLGLPALALVVVMWLFGAPFVELLLGAAYVPLVPLLVLMLFAASLELMTAGLRPAGYAANQAGLMLRIQVGSTAIYLLAFVICTVFFGLVGAGMAALAGTIIGIAGMMAVLWQTVRRPGRLA